MSIPNKATGYGGTSARYVFSFYTDQALSSKIKYEAYDNDQTFPATDTVTTSANYSLAGTTANSHYPMVCLIDTTSAAPASAGWKPATPSAGEANPNRLRGQTYYVEQDGSTLGAGTAAYFNMIVEVPYDLETTDAMGFDLTVRYTYTGTAPTPYFRFNEGSDATPSWTNITVDTHGIKHCRSGSTASYLYANIPESGTEDTAEGWVTT